MKAFSLGYNRASQAQGIGWGIITRFREITRPSLLLDRTQSYKHHGSVSVENHLHSAQSAPLRFVLALLLTLRDPKRFTEIPETHKYLRTHQVAAVQNSRCLARPDYSRELQVFPQATVDAVLCGDLTISSNIAILKHVSRHISAARGVNRMKILEILQRLLCNISQLRHPYRFRLCHRWCANAWQACHDKPCELSSVSVQSAKREPDPCK